MLACPLVPSCRMPVGLEMIHAYPTCSAAQLLLNGAEPLCRCAVQVAAACGGHGPLARLLSASIGSNQPGSVLEFQHEGRELHCVQPGSSAASWGIVGQHGDQPWCLTCPSHQRHCAHVQQLRDTVPSAAATSAYLGPLEFERKLQEDFDLAEGRRRLTCLSRLPLPAHLPNDQQLHNVLIGEVSGTSCLLPARWSLAFSCHTYDELCMTYMCCSIAG